MAKLTFTGRSKDGKRLLLVDESGQEHTLAVDARLRRAFAGAPDSNGQLEIPMESSLRPRDIQMRIRAGESPEAVAHAAGTSVEKIMAFAAPVMAERAHVADRAQLASVRRRASESGARTLGEAVAAQLRAHNVDPGSVEWDAWRREDGRWTLTALYDVAGRVGTATFSHDPRGSFVTVDDEDARWLVGDATRMRRTLPTPRPPPTTSPPRGSAGSRGRRGRPAGRRRDRDGHRRGVLRVAGGDHDGALRHRTRCRAARGGLPRRGPGRPGPRRGPRPGPRQQPGRAGRPSPSARRPPRPRPSRSRSPPRSAVAPRCRAGTRSCSVAARATDA